MRKTSVRSGSASPDEQNDGKPTHFRTSGLTSGVAPSRVPQPHGGELLAGGLPGHRGAGGRPKDEVRQLALRGFEQNLDRLIRIAAGTEYRVAVVGDPPRAVNVQPTFKESIDAMRELGNRGLGKMIEVETPTTPVSFAFYCSPEEAARRARESIDEQ